MVYRNTVNPYDFANPVSDPDLFAGRTTELDEILYYLDHAAKAPRAINLAVIGERASGKTSILNMIQRQTSNRGLVSVRIDLDETNGSFPLPLFYKIFDAIVTTVCEQGAYGGPDGRTYQIYRDIVDTYDIPSDRTFVSFGFSLQYAKAMSRQNESAAVSDTLLRKDLIRISEEVGKTIVLLIDEGNVLAQNRTLLQMIRNTFMNTPGYMLVLTGTPELFPVISDVFSPVMRQFKKLDISPFQNWQETRECVLKPLEKIGIARAEEIFETETFYDVTEIHNLTGGRPYEIQLICHFLFKRLQMGKSKRMRLTIDVLDDVLRELQSSQDITSRHIIAYVRSIDHHALVALAHLCQCNRMASFDQLSFLAYVFDAEPWLREGLRGYLDQFVEAGVLEVKDENISFQGDDFDKIYCKYFARKKDVVLNVQDMPFEPRAVVNLAEYFTKRIKSLDSHGFGGLDEVQGVTIQEVVNTFYFDIDKLSSMMSFDALQTLYWSNIQFQGKEVMDLVMATFITPWFTGIQVFRLEPEDNPEETFHKFEGELKMLTERTHNFDSDIHIDYLKLPVLSVSELMERIDKISDKRFRSRLAGMHNMEMVREYFNEANPELALVHVQLASHLWPSANILNNQGYIYMVLDKSDTALPLIEKAKDLAVVEEDTFTAALAVYNLSLIKVKQGLEMDAIRDLGVIAERLRNMPKDRRWCAELLQPIVNNGDLLFMRVAEPDLLEIVDKAIECIVKNISTGEDG